MSEIDKGQVDPKCIAEDIQEGDFLSEIQYYKVIETVGDTLRVENERGFQFSISKAIAQEGMYSGNQFLEEQKVSQTELAELLQEAGDSVFTLNFNKKIKPSDVLESLKGVAKKDLSERIIADALAGEERTLVGYKVNSEPSLGRTQVVDLETEVGGYRLRLVDHRTINWIVLKNVKYTLKRKRSN